MGNVPLAAAEKRLLRRGVGAELTPESPGKFTPRRAACELCLEVSSGRLLAERVLPLSILALAAVSVPVLMLSPAGLGRLDGLRQERTRAEDEISRLSQQIVELRAQVQRIKSDPTAVERVARDELGLLRKTEIVFQFDDRH